MSTARSWRATALFLAPASIFYGVFMLYPIAESARLSLFKWNGQVSVAPKFVGWGNYLYMLQDETFFTSLKNVALYLAINVAVQLPLGFILAAFLALERRGGRYFKAAFFVPVVLSATAVSLMWRFILAPDGLLDSVLQHIGLGAYRTVWLADPDTNMSAISLVGAWQGVGYVMILLLAALVGIPRNLNEQSMIDGANWIQRTRYITLPLIKPAIRTNVVLLIIGSIRVADIVIVMTNGGPVHSSEVPTTYMYTTTFKEGYFGLGAAISTTIFVIALGLAILANRILKSED